MHFRTMRYFKQYFPFFDAMALDCLVGSPKCKIIIKQS